MTYLALQAKVHKWNNKSKEKGQKAHVESFNEGEKNHVEWTKNKGGGSYNRGKLKFSNKNV